MKDHADPTMNPMLPTRGVLITGACIAAILAGSVWSNLLSGRHQPFERSAAPAPVMVEPAPRQQSAGAATNTYPASSVNVSVAQRRPAAAADDPLGQLILQTGSIDAAPDAGANAIGDVAEANLVLQAQKAMAALKFYKGPVDGLVGPAHEQAVRTYQAMHGLPVTGIVTRPLLDHMQMTATVEAAQSTDVSVHRVQSWLARLGYAPGAVDGRLGEQTREAIRMFEADRGWPVTGNISAQLLAELDDAGGSMASATSN